MLAVNGRLSKACRAISKPGHGWRAGAAKPLFLCIALVSLTQISAYVWGCHTLTKNMSKMRETLAAAGWQNIGLEKPSFHPSFFGATTTVLHFAMQNNVSASADASRLELRARPWRGIDARFYKLKIVNSEKFRFEAPVVKIKFGVLTNSPLIEIPQFATISGSRSYQSVLLAYHFDAFVIWTQAKRGKPASLALRGAIDRAQVSTNLGVYALKSPFLPKVALHAITLEAAADLARDDPKIFSQIFIQKLGGLIGPTSFIAAGKLDGQGHGHLTLRLTNIRNGLRVWFAGKKTSLTLQQSPRNVRLLAEQLQGELPDQLSIPIALNNFQPVNEALDQFLMQMQLDKNSVTERGN